MLRRCCEFEDSRLRRSPPDRASAVAYGQAGGKRNAFPPPCPQVGGCHKLHSTPQQHGMILFRGMIKPAAGYRPLAYSSPEAVQTTGTVALPSVSTPLLILTINTQQTHEITCYYQLPSQYSARAQVGCRRAARRPTLRHPALS